MKNKKLLSLSLLIAFLLSQISALDHQKDHFKEDTHATHCAICLFHSDIFHNFPQEIQSITTFDKESVFHIEPFYFVKDNFFSQSLPRSPPFSS